MAPWRPVTTGGLVRRLGRADLRHRRARPHRHGGGAAGQGARLSRRLLRSATCRTARSWPSASRGRARSRPCCEQTDTLSIHAPLTRETRGLIGGRELARLKPSAVLVNTARGAIVDLDGVYEQLKSGHLAAAGLDVVPVEPPVEPLPRLLAAYRAREPWLTGRLVITPHAAYYSPQAEHDTRVKAAETMRAALLSNKPQNVITPDMD